MKLQSTPFADQAAAQAQVAFPRRPPEQAAFVRGYVHCRTLRRGPAPKGLAEAYEAGRNAAKAAMQPNPLGFWCAPNQATPDYVSCSNVADFIAYGMMLCHRELQEMDGYTPDASHYHELRGYFLNAVERALTVYPQIKRGKRYHDDDAPQDTLNFTADASRAAVAAGKEPEEEFVFRWLVETVDSDGNLCLVLNWAFVGSAAHHEADDVAIWIAAELMQGHKREWKQALAHARRMTEWLV